jgi:hypothetical protein
MKEESTLQRGSGFRDSSIKERDGSDGIHVTSLRYVVGLELGAFQLNSCNPFGQLCKTESWQTRYYFWTLNTRCLEPNLVIKKSNVFFFSFQPVLRVWKVM